MRSLVLAVLIASGAAQAQVATRNPAEVRPGSYAVEPSHTRVVFAVSHMGFTTWYGNFTGVSGTLTLNAANPAASSVAVTIPAASITTTNAVLDDKLKNSAWLDAASYPDITFTSSSVTPTGPGTADIAGKLTLHGFTHPVTLRAKFNGAGTNPLDRAYTVGFDANTVIKRSAFGINTYVPLIGDDVVVTISAAFEKK
jgi:polyisoprenoid-binding protein YceI